MTNILASILLFCLTRVPTVAALGLSFIIGSVWGMWIQFSNDDKQKDAHRTAMR